MAIRENIMKNYYDKEFEEVITTKKNSLSLQIINVHTGQSTKWVNLNPQSIDSLISFLNKIKKETGII